LELFVFDGFDWFVCVVVGYVLSFFLFVVVFVFVLELVDCFVGGGCGELCIWVGWYVGCWLLFDGGCECFGCCFFGDVEVVELVGYGGDYLCLFFVVGLGECFGDSVLVYLFRNGCILILRL